MENVKSTVTTLNEKGDTAHYARLSNKASDDKLVTTGVQLNELAGQSKRAGEMVFRTYVDDGISAWKPEARRDAFLTMLRDIKAGKIKTVRAVRSNRISRQTGELDALITLCIRHEVTLITEGQAMDFASPMAVAMVKVAGVLNEMDSSIKSISVKLARAEAARQGIPHSGHRPFGYSEDRMTPHPVEAPLYLELVERVVGGESTHAIAVDWAKRKIVNRAGNPFAAGTLRRLVRSRRHAGFRIHHGEVLRQGNWEPLITPELQSRASTMLKSHARQRRTPLGANPALLQGMAICGVCDSKMWIQRKNASTTTVARARYICSSAKCGKVTSEVANSDTEVEQQFLYRLTLPKTRRALAKIASAAPGVASALSRLDKITAKVEMLKEMFDGDEIEPDDYRSQMKTLTVNRRVIERELGDAKAPEVLTTDPDTLIEKWDDLSVEEKRANFAAIIDCVRIIPHVGTNRKVFQPERIKPKWRC